MIALPTIRLAVAPQDADLRAALLAERRRFHPATAAPFRSLRSALDRHHLPLRPALRSRLSR